MARLSPPTTVAPVGPSVPMGVPSAPVLGEVAQPTVVAPAVNSISNTSEKKLPKLVMASTTKPETGSEGKTHSLWNLVNPMAWNKAMTEVEMSFIKGVPHMISGLGGWGGSVGLYGDIQKPTIARTGKEIGASLKKTVTGGTIKEAIVDIKAGRPPVMPIVETAGNVALVTGVAGGIAGAAAKGLSAEAAAAASGSTFVAGTEAASTVSAAEAAAAAGAKGTIAGDLAKAATRLRQIEKVSGKIGAGPALYHLTVADQIVKGAGIAGRAWADSLRAKGIALLEADPNDLVGKSYINRANKANAWAGKPLVAEGIKSYANSKAEVLNQKVLDSWTRRYTRAADAAEARVTRAMQNIVDSPHLVDEMGPLTAVEQEAVIASLNGRARLIARLAPLLKLSPETINQLGRLNYNEKFAMSPEGAKLAVDFVNNNLSKAQSDRLAIAAEQLSAEIEKQSSQARKGYGRSNPLDASHDMPFPVVEKFMASLKAKGIDDLHAEMLDLQEQGFFNDLSKPEVADYMRSVVNRAPRDIALDPMLYPAKERYNLAFYNRLRQGLESQAQMTAGGSPIPPGTYPGRPGPSMPETGLPAEAVYDQTKGLGSLSRTPRNFLVNSVKILDKLKGRVRILGEQLVELEMKSGKLERDIIRKRLEYETLTGWHEDAQGNRILLEPGEVPGPGVTRRQGQLELLREHRDAVKAVYDEMVAKQNQSVVVDGKIVTAAELSNAVQNADSLVAQAEGMVNQIIDDAGQISDAIDQVENDKADAANALDDAGVDPQPLAEAAIEDSLAMSNDVTNAPSVDPRADVQAQLEQAKITEKALADEYNAARIEVVDTRAAMEEAAAAEKASRAPKPAAVVPARVGGYGPDALVADLQDAIPAGKSSTAEVNRVKKKFDTEYVPPKNDAAVAKNAEKVYSGADQGGLRSTLRTAMVKKINGKFWYTNSYFAIPLDENSFFYKKLVGMGETDGGQYRSVAKSVSDVSKADITKYSSDVPAIDALIDTVDKNTKNAAPATILGVNTLPADGPVVILQNADGTTIAVNKQYFDATVKNGDTIHFVETNKPIGVRNANGEIVGIIMPIRGDLKIPTAAEVLDNVVGSIKDGALRDIIRKKIESVPAESQLAQPEAVAGPQLTPPQSQAAEVYAAAKQRYINAQDAAAQIETDYRQAQGQTYSAEQQLKALDQAPAEPIVVKPIDTVETQVTKPIINVADEAAWANHGNDNWSVDTGTRKYTAQRVEEGTTKAGKPKARWTSRRIASDGLPIESTSMDFKSFKELRDYIAETTKVDAQVLLETPVYRPGRELGEAKGLLTPPDLLKAEKRLAAAEGRAVSLTRNIEKGEGRLLKMRETEAVKRAELVSRSQEAVGLEARLGREIYTQPDVTTVDGKPTGRMFVAPQQGAPSVVRSVQEGNVPTGGTGPGRTQLRPMAQYTRTVEEMATDAATENVALVDRSLAEANLRRAEMLTQDIPLDVAMSTPRDLGQEYSGSQYVMGGQEAVRSTGPVGTQTRGLSGKITVTSEKLRGANEGIYDIVELGRRMAKEQRQLTLNEGFKFVMNSKFAVTPAYLLGETKVNELRQKAYEMAVGNPFGADAVVGGVGAYAEGLLNRDALVRQQFNNAFGDLIHAEMSKLGWETLPEKGAISDRVYVDKITPETKYLPAYAVDRIASKWIPYDASTGRRVIDLYLKANNYVTRAFKNLTLPLSVSWQIGDFVSNMMVANIFGVNPAAMARGLSEALKQNFGDMKGAYNYVVRNEMPTLGPKAELIAPHVQDIGLRMEESLRSRGLTQTETPSRLSQVPGLKTPIEFMQAVKNGSYRFNETINRLQRHAFMLEKLGQNLDGLGWTIDNIVDRGIDAAPSNVQEAFYDAVDTANDVLGDFMDLNKSERQLMLAHMPFYSWIKHVHKLYFKVLREHPSAILWHAYVGSFVYDPEADPYGLTTGMWGVPGGFGSGNLMTPFADVWGGPLYEGLNKNNWSRAGSAFNPLVRTGIAAFTGFNIGQGRNITRPAGTAQLSQSGYQQNTPLAGRPKELLGFAAQQFPLLTKIADIMPETQLPGTTMQLGPVKRYDTGQARPGPLGLGEQKKYGGRLLAIPRLFTVPGLPTVSPEELRKRTLDAQMQNVRAAVSKEKAKLKSGQ